MLSKSIPYLRAMPSVKFWNIQMAGLSPFLLAQIDKYLNKENFKIQMCPGGAAQI